MLKYGLLDLVHCNCMQVPMCEENKHLTCSSIEEYIKYDQHRSLLLAQAEAEDMKALKGMYGETVL